MSLEFESDRDEAQFRRRAARLEGYHRRKGLTIVPLAVGFLAFLLWASLFRIDEVVRAPGEVIARGRVQVIQAVDGGVLLELNVREGDTVEPGRVLARLNPTRVDASQGESEARLQALTARVIRLRAEVTREKTVNFPAGLQRDYPETVNLELGLFRQRRAGLETDIELLRAAVELARREQALVYTLYRNGDASGTELLRAERNLNDAESRLAGRENKFLEDARAELARAEDERAQTSQVLRRKRQELQDTVLVAQVRGVVKNVRTTTIGGVLRGGDELMQIVPVADERLVEVRVKPADIGKMRAGLEATIRFDAYDYTLYGAVSGQVVYVGPDTLKEDTKAGVEAYYRIHVTSKGNPASTRTGRSIPLVPGMTAQVDIRTGDRTLLSYLLKPVRRTVTESFGER